jgi:G3E family GTPase
MMAWAVQSISTVLSLALVRDRVVSINGAAKIHVTDHSRTPQIEGVVLDLHAYDQLSRMDFSEKGHAHIDPKISTIALTHPKITPAQIPLVDEWLRSVLWKSIVKESGDTAVQHSTFEVHRLKGILALTDGTFKIIQAVREMYEIRDSEHREKQDDQFEIPSHCKIVIIGRDLRSSAEPWQNTFNQALQI